MALSDYISKNEQIYNYRGGGPENPISIYKIVNSSIFRLIVSIEEPSFDGVPINVLWMCMDPKSTYLNKVYIRTSKAPDTVNSTRNTWTQITDEANLYNSPQIYDLGGSMLLGELLPADEIPNASNNIEGLVLLSVAPVDNSKPLAVGDNDPRMSDPRTPLPHTHPLMPSIQLLTPTGSIQLNTSNAPVTGNVLIADSTAANATWRNLTQNDIYVPPKHLTGLTISGPSTAFETDTNVAYTCTATFDNGSSVQVTPSWSSSNTYADINNGGDVTIHTLTVNESVTITATYTFNGATLTATHGLFITHIPILVSINIIGQSTIVNGANATYTATATFNDSTVTTITNPSWSLTNIAVGANATVNAGGVLTAVNVPTSFAVTLNASYTQAGITKTATKQVNLTAAVIALDHIIIHGSTSVTGLTTSQYSITAYFSDGSTTTPSTGITWSLATGTYDSINSSGLLSVQSLPVSETDTVDASYTVNGVTKTATLPINLVSNNPLLISVAITGSTSLYTGSSYPYTLTATYNDGSSKVLSTGITWSLTSAVYDSISTSGNVTTINTVPATENDQVNASYTENGITKTATLPITIAQDSVTGLAIVGPNSVASGSTTAYSATLTYTSSKTVDVTSSTTFTAYPGAFTSASFVAPNETVDTNTTFTANYVLSGHAYQATKIVVITAAQAATLLVYYGNTTLDTITTPTQIQNNLINTFDPTDPTNDPWSLSYGSTDGYGYIAFPSTVANAAHVQFSNGINTGGWDGANAGTGTPLPGAGPKLINDTYNGSPITWYLYRTDYSNITSNYTASW